MSEGWRVLREREILIFVFLKKIMPKSVYKSGISISKKSTHTFPSILAIMALNVVVVVLLLV